mmetsp:Transcript_7701/g.19120  ORF Transcript_7701/g.19120 Transcript_7701/m.19120 type:complete len:375 (+) Transcript_7701:303-1427(+)
MQPSSPPPSPSAQLQRPVVGRPLRDELARPLLLRGRALHLVPPVHLLGRQLEQAHQHLPAQLRVKLGFVVDGVHVALAVAKLHVQVREVGRDGLAQPLLGVGLNGRLGMVLRPLALRLHHGLLEVARRLLQLALGDWHAVQHRVVAARAQVHGGLREDDALALRGEHLDEAFDEVLHLSPHRVVDLAQRGRVVVGHNDAVARHQPPARGQHEVRGGARGDGQVARPPRVGGAVLTRVLRLLLPVERRHLPRPLARHRLLRAPLLVPRLGQLQPRVVVVLCVRVQVARAEARLAHDVGRHRLVQVVVVVVAVLGALDQRVQVHVVVVLEVARALPVVAVPLHALLVVRVARVERGARVLAPKRAAHRAPLRVHQW